MQVHKSWDLQCHLSSPKEADETAISQGHANVCMCRLFVVVVVFKSIQNAAGLSKTTKL